MKTQHTSVTMFRTVILTTIFICLLIGCDSTNPMLDIGAVEEASQNSLLAPRNPDTYMVYIQPDDPDYHLMNIPCLESGRTVVTEAEALEQGHTPCEICFPPPPEPIVPKIYIVTDSNLYHGLLCPHLNDTKEIIPKTEALAIGYTACPRCFPGEYVSPPPSVYFVPETMEYHFALCPDLTGEEEIMLKADALEAGCTPHECALELTIHGGVVYITTTGQEDGIYHTNRNCHSLDHLTNEQKNDAIQMRWLLEPGFRKCLNCDDERHIEDL